MFWKKKTAKKSRAPFNLSFDLDRRNYYRVRPEPGKPVSLQIKERRFLVDDLSAGGLAVVGSGLNPGQQLAGVLRLPGAEPIPLMASVVKPLPGGKLALVIDKIKPDGQEAIHQYVLERQKKELEEKRAQAKAAAQRQKERARDQD